MGTSGPHRVGPESGSGNNHLICQMMRNLYTLKLIIKVKSTRQGILAFVKGDMLRYTIYWFKIKIPQNYNPSSWIVRPANAKFAMNILLKFIQAFSYIFILDQFSKN